MIYAALFLMILGARPGLAQVPATPEPEPHPQWLGQMLEEGWQVVGEGVLERRPGGNRVETFTYGEEGLRFTARRLKQRIRSLQREQRAYPSPELAQVIATLEGDLARAKASLSGAQAGSSGGSGSKESPVRTPLCIPLTLTEASAGPLPEVDAPGVTASASAFFSDTCGQLGNVYSYAHARATPEGSTLVDSRTQEQGRFDGTSLESAATVSVSGSLDCYSQAYARAWTSTMSINYEATEENYECPDPVQKTFLGKPFAVPGTIKAADFDHGGEGISYHDTTPGNISGSTYRTGTDVDMYEDNVYSLAAGEWLEYTIDVTTAGSYALIAQVGSDSSGGSFHVELDGVDVTGPVAVPNSGNWTRWRSATKAGVRFPAGRHVLRFVADTYFDSFYSLRVVVAQVPFGGTVRTLPGTVRAVDFDDGGQLISYQDNTAGCEGLCEYREADVDRYEHLIWRTTPSEWMEYTVDVTATGTYTLAVRVGSESSGGIFHVEFDGVDVTGPMTFPATGGWNTFQTVTRTVSLSAGRKVMRLVVDSDAGYSEAGTFDSITVQP